MAQNLELIRRAITSHPEGICDDCLSKISGITPRQSVRAICVAESLAGKFSREKRECPQDGCRKIKLVNALATSPPGNGLAPSKIPTTTLREQTDVLSNCLYDMNEMLRRLDEAAQPGEPFAACVTRLRKDGFLPGKIAAMMLTVNAMRVEVVKGRKALPADEWEAMHAIWRALDRWKKEHAVH